jgi:hypothetical protein
MIFRKKNYLILFATCFILKLSLADQPCPPPPCYLSVEKNTCVAQADWIVEGTLWDVISSVKTVCQTLSNPLCVQVKGTDTVIFEKVTFIKGQIEKSLSEVAVIKGASHCWKDAAGFPAAVKGVRYRIYGKDNFNATWTQPGFFAWERID